jgi:DNA-binding NarL/FixJ family response regulator
MLKMLVADDHPLFREALQGAISTSFQDVTFVESDSLTSSLSALRKHRNVSIILLDLTMPGCDHFYGLLRLKQSFPDIPIAIISASETLDVISQSMEFGAQAFIPKTTATPELIKALEHTLAGNKWLPEGVEEQLGSVDSNTVEVAHQVRVLTPKQFQVLKHVKQGMMNKEIAETLCVTEATVKAHIGTLFKRLNVRSRAQIIVAVEKLQLE